MPCRPDRPRTPLKRRRTCGAPAPSFTYVNLIPYNPVDEAEQFQRPTRAAVFEFRDVLENMNVPASIRQTSSCDASETLRRLSWPRPAPPRDGGSEIGGLLYFWSFVGQCLVNFGLILVHFRSSRWHGWTRRGLKCRKMLTLKKICHFFIFSNKTIKRVLVSCRQLNTTGEGEALLIRGVRGEALLREDLLGEDL